METVAWQELEANGSSRMSDARRQAHNALHWLARIANSYRPSEADNSHVALVWNPDTNALRTQEIADSLSVELRLAHLELQFCENGEPVPHVLSFEDRTPAHVEAWILVELLHRGIDRSSFSKDIPYAANNVMLGDSEEHAPEEFTKELNAIDGWFRNAAAICTALRHDFARTEEDAAPDVSSACWPQTFQLGLEVPLLQGSGAPALRIGLSAGDDLRPDPYFFVGTIEQSVSGDFDPDSLLSSRRILEDNMSADDVLKSLSELTSTHKKRLAG